MNANVAQLWHDQISGWQTQLQQFGWLSICLIALCFVLGLCHSLRHDHFRQQHRLLPLPPYNNTHKGL